MKKRFSSVNDLIKSMDLPDAQKKRHTQYIKERKLSRLLTVMRAQQDMSQTEAAKKLGWTQGRVSKLETKVDRQISLGDILDYSDALGMEVSLMFLPKKMKIVDRVKLHAFQMTHHLQRLVKLSKGDKQMEEGVDRFHEECQNYLNRMIGDSQKELRPRKKQELTLIGPQQVAQMIEQEEAELELVS